MEDLDKSDLSLVSLSETDKNYLPDNGRNDADFVSVSGVVLRHAFESTLEPQIIFNLVSGIVLRANKAASNFFKLSDQTIIGRTIGQLYSDEKGILYVFTEEVLDRGSAWTRDLKLTRPDGKPFSLEHRALAVTLNGQTYILLQILDLDVIKRRSADEEAISYHREGINQWRKAERYFREIERENQLILAAAGEGIYGVNADGVTTFVNPAAETMLGYRASELVGKDMHTVIHHHKADGSIYPVSDCPIYNAFRQGSVKTVDDEVFWGKGNQPVRVEYTSTPIVDSGAVVGAVIVFRDISKRKKDEEQLKSALEENARLRERLEMENAYLQEEIRSHTNHYDIIGASSAIDNILKQIELVAPTDANVLISGESGTGKELVARAIHRVSSRRDRPLIRVNCAAIPRELFESEFFGHVKGAFTGALRDRVGRFELANGGTIFLDEVGEIPLDLQSKLLRVLQDLRFERVGEEKTRTVDVRVIAATNRDLKREASNGRFREDLYFRLNVVPIECTPLRDRLNDIPLLAAHFLETVCARMNIHKPELTKANIENLLNYNWPGNARELQNVLERAAILARGKKLSFDLPNNRGESTSAGLNETGSHSHQERISSGDMTVSGSVKRIYTISEMEAMERENLKRALDHCDGRVSGENGAAVLLGIRPTTLYSRIKAMKI